MRLLHTLTTYPPSVGGAQLHQYLLGLALPQHDIQVLTYWKQNRTDWLLGTTINAPSKSYDYHLGHIAVHQLGIRWIDKLRMLLHLPLYYPLMPYSVAQLSQQLLPYIYSYGQGVDLIHNVRIGREIISYASLQLARHYDVPFVLTPVHHPRWVGWRYRVFNDIYRQADGILALTNAERQILIQLGVSEAKIHVIGHGPIIAKTSAPDAFRKEHQLSGPIVLFLGQHYEYKGYQQLLAAMSNVWIKVPDAQFVFIGPAVRNSEELFKEFKDKRLHRLGAVDLQTKTNALAACDVLCVPSTQESFGGVYTEAWMFKKPVIGANIPAVADVITDGVDGFLIEQTPKAIAKRILDILLEPQMAKTMGEAGEKKVKRLYTWPAIATKVDEAYRKILTG